MSPDDPTSLVALSVLARNYASAFAVLAALFAGLFGLVRYLRGERLRQTDQIRSLYAQFFESDRYRRIRFVLDAPDSPEFAQLVSELKTGGMPKPLESELIDLLNFFEFVTGLMRRGLLARGDVDWMFRNFIDRVVAIEPVRAYVLDGDYKELADICRRALKGRSAGT
jgi:hypothetical protein